MSEPFYYEQENARAEREANDLRNEVFEEVVTRTDRLVAAAETALLHLSYMRAEAAPEWSALEEALLPFRADCPCGMKNAPPSHLDAAPYFCCVCPDEPGCNHAPCRSSR